MSHFLLSVEFHFEIRLGKYKQCDLFVNFSYKTTDWNNILMQLSGKPNGKAFFSNPANFLWTFVIKQDVPPTPPAWSCPFFLSKSNTKKNWKKERKNFPKKKSEFFSGREGRRAPGPWVRGRPPPPTGPDIWWQNLELQGTPIGPDIWWQNLEL